MAKDKDEIDREISEIDGDVVELSPSTHEFPKIISFEALTRCGDEIWIENAGSIYRLRRTRQGKLILTK